MNRKASRFLAYPYIIWMAGFTVIPLLMVFYYGLTDRSGAFTLANILAIGSYEHLKALWLSLLLAGVSTVICLILAYPLALILRKRHIGKGSFVVDNGHVKEAGRQEVLQRQVDLAKEACALGVTKEQLWEQIVRIYEENETEREA